MLDELKNIVAVNIFAFSVLMIRSMEVSDWIFALRKGNYLRQPYNRIEIIPYKFDLTNMPFSGKLVH